LVINWVEKAELVNGVDSGTREKVEEEKKKRRKEEEVRSCTQI
jgi:hypothetical protein